MLVSEFVQGFNNLHKPEAQKDWCQKHLIKTYAPIGEKNAVLTRFVYGCVKVGDNGISYIDMIANKINFTWAIVCLYTDLQLDIAIDEVKDENGNVKLDDKGQPITKKRQDVIGLYDQFQQYDIISVFCDLIGEREINELILVNNRVLDTWHDEHSSSRAYISELVDKAVRTFAETAAVMKEIVPEEEKKGLSGSIKQFMGVSQE